MRANKGVSKGGAENLPLLPLHTLPPHQPGAPSPCSQLHTIDCEVHPGAVSRIVFGAVPVQEEHAAFVPALVFHPEPLDLERCPLLQADSPWRRSPESGCCRDPREPQTLVTLVLPRGQHWAQSLPVTLMEGGLERRRGY